MIAIRKSFPRVILKRTSLIGRLFSAAPPIDTSIPHKHVGYVKGIKIHCISETGWFDTQKLLDDVKAAGGLNASQYGRHFEPTGCAHKENAGGSSSLLEVEETNGRVRRILFDCGWGDEWMDKRFKDCGVDTLLKRRQIECMVLSHEHFDHFFGIPNVLKLCPELHIYVPFGFRRAGFDLLRDAGHKGPVTVIPNEMPFTLFTGAVIRPFSTPSLFQISSENVLYFNVKDKGIVMVTGCGHGGVLTLLEQAKTLFEDTDKIHAIYGGLHISPFGEWSDEKEKLIEGIASYGIDHIACNHCTGTKAVERMQEKHMPLVGGSAKDGSVSKLFVGNGDIFEV